MIKIQITPESLKRATQRARRLRVSTKEAIKDLNKRTAYKIEFEAKKEVPVKTGRLRASIDSTFSWDGLKAEVGTNVEYAIPVEFRKPYLFPASDKVKPKYIKELERVLNKVANDK